MGGTYTSSVSSPPQSVVLFVFVIGLLCVHVGPHMVDSMIHRQGGPFFFVLSLFPLFLLLWWLRRQEQRLNLPG